MKEVDKIVNEILERRGLSSILTNYQTEMITYHMTNVVNENAVNTNSKEFEENAKVLLTSIEKDSKDLLEKASKTYKKDNNFLQSMLENIKRIIRSVVDSFSHLLNKFL